MTANLKVVVFWVVGRGSKKHDTVIGGWQWLVDRFLEWRRPRSRRNRTLQKRSRETDIGWFGWMEDGETDLGIPAIRSSELQLEMVLSPLEVLSLRSSSDSITVTIANHTTMRYFIFYLYILRLLPLPAAGSESVKVRVVNANLEANHHLLLTQNSVRFSICFFGLEPLSYRNKPICFTTDVAILVKIGLLMLFCFFVI